MAYDFRYDNYSSQAELTAYFARSADQQGRLRDFDLDIAEMDQREDDEDRRDRLIFNSLPGSTPGYFPGEFDFPIFQNAPPPSIIFWHASHIFPLRILFLPNF